MSLQSGQMREVCVGPVQDLHYRAGYTLLHLGLTFGVSILLHSKSLWSPESFCFYELYLLILTILEIQTETF